MSGGNSGIAGTEPKSERLDPFLGVWSTTLLSNLGDGLYQFALPLIAFGITDSPAAVAGVTVMLTLAWPLFGLQAGSIVDWSDRRLLLLGVNLVRAFALGMLAASIITDALSLPVLYLCALFLGVGETLVDTALTAIVPSVVSRDRLAWANARVTAGQTVTNTFVGPPLAGVLVGVGWAVAVAVPAALYGLAVGFLSLLSGPYRASPTTVQNGQSRRAHITAGLRFLWRVSLLRKITVFTAAMNIWWAAWTALIVPYAVSPGPMGLSEIGYGLVLATMAIGSLAGSLVAGRTSQLLGVKGALTLDMVGTALLLAVPALTTSPILVGAAVFSAGFGASIWVILVATIRQRITPPDLQGRVYSASRLVSWGVLPIGAGIAGITAEIIGIPSVFLVGTIASVALLGAFVHLMSGDELAMAN